MDRSRFNANIPSAGLGPWNCHVCRCANAAGGWVCAGCGTCRYDSEDIEFLHRYGLLTRAQQPVSLCVDICDYSRRSLGRFSITVAGNAHLDAVIAEMCRLGYASPSEEYLFLDQKMPARTPEYRHIQPFVYELPAASLALMPLSALPASMRHYTGGSGYHALSLQHPARVHRYLARRGLAQQADLSYPITVRIEDHSVPQPVVRLTMKGWHQAGDVLEELRRRRLVSNEDYEFFGWPAAHPDWGTDHRQVSACLCELSSWDLRLLPLPSPGEFR